jgi:hypothetical protein
MANRLKWLVVLLSATLPVCAATPGSISGMVKSGDGTPQMGALVEIFAAGALQPMVAFTGQSGNYQVPDLSPGSYRLKVTAVAFLPSLIENVVVRSGGRAVINVTLNTIGSGLSGQLLTVRFSALTTTMGSFLPLLPAKFVTLMRSRGGWLLLRDLRLTALAVGPIMALASMYSRPYFPLTPCRLLDVWEMAVASPPE